MREQRVNRHGVQFFRVRGLLDQNECGKFMRTQHVRLLRLFDLLGSVDDYRRAGRLVHAANCPLCKVLDHRARTARAGKIHSIPPYTNYQGVT
ncbi:hypothetical protein D9M73_271000 [compost metagenome]